MSTRARQLGFTFIELLVVLGIIVLLASFALPNLVSARAKANDAVAHGYAKQMLGYATMWLADDPTNDVGDLIDSCTANQYIAQGAPKKSPQGVKDCQVEAMGSANYMVKVTSITGKVFELKQ